MIDPIALVIFGIKIHWYGIIIACALVIAAVIGIKEAKRHGYRSEMLYDFLIIAIPLCIICARIYYVIFQWDYYSSDFLSVFAIWEGGLAIYGAIIGGVLAAFIFYKWRKVPLGEMLDIAAPCLAIGQAIGRWGNFVNQEAFGQAVTNTAWQKFPFAVYIESSKYINGITYQAGYYMATFFYESMWDMITFAIIMILRKKLKPRGGVFALYLVCYGFGRFFTESLRTDSLMIGSIRVSQLLSVVLFACGIIYIVVMSKKKLEYPLYEGLYSLSWSEEKVENYKKNIKKIKAEEYAKEAEKEVEKTIDMFGPASDMAKKAKKKAEEARKKADIISEKNAEKVKKEEAEKTDDKAKDKEESVKKEDKENKDE
jgi:phosphatidylglycerol---prolipoprotein diacylglyceryl transferase